MKHIGLKHQRENKQNSDKNVYLKKFMKIQGGRILNLISVTFPDFHNKTPDNVQYFTLTVIVTFSLSFTKDYFQYKRIDS